MKAQEYPLWVASAIGNLIKELKKIYSNHTGVIDIIEKKESLLFLKDKSSDCFFEIKDVMLYKKPKSEDLIEKVFFKVQFNPFGNKKPTLYTDINGHIRTVELFQEWAETIESYHEAAWDSSNENNTEKDDFIPFEEVEPESISVEQIDAALKLLQSSLEENKAKYSVDFIIRDVHTLQKHLASLPEKVIKEMGRDILKEIADLGKDAVKDIIKDGMKDFVKYLFYGEAVRQFLIHLPHLL